MPPDSNINPDSLVADTPIANDPLVEIPPPSTDTAGAPIVAPPIVPVATVIAGGGTAPVVTVPLSPMATPLQTQPINEEKETDIKALIRQSLIDGMRDITGSAEIALASFADTYAPLMARQAILMTSDDADQKALATGHMKSLQSQAILTATQYGIELQQRQEQNFLMLFRTLIRIGVAALTAA